jgi:hypothetical protein
MPREIVNWLAEHLDAGQILFILGAGLGSYWIDGRILQAQGLFREARLARRIGLAYILGGILLWLVVRFLLWLT